MDDTNLFEAGLLDSLAVVQVIEHLEEAYGARFGGADFDPQELSCLRGIIAVLTAAAA